MTVLWKLKPKPFHWQWILWPIAFISGDYCKWPYWIGLEIGLFLASQRMSWFSMQSSNGLLRDSRPGYHVDKLGNWKQKQIAEFNWEVISADSGNRSLRKPQCNLQNLIGNTSLWTNGLLREVRPGYHKADKFGIEKQEQIRKEIQWILEIKLSGNPNVIWGIW